MKRLSGIYCKILVFVFFGVVMMGMLPYGEYNVQAKTGKNTKATKASLWKYRKIKTGNGYWEGYFCSDEITGYGSYVWNDGSKYEGQIVNGKFEGKGVFYDENGNYEYVGFVSFDFKQGYGIQFFDNGYYIGNIISSMGIGNSFYYFDNYDYYIYTATKTGETKCKIVWKNGDTKNIK